MILKSKLTAVYSAGGSVNWNIHFILDLSQKAEKRWTVTLKDSLTLSSKYV